MLFLLVVSWTLVAATSTSENIPGRIVGAALVESEAFEKLSYLSDRIGHRLSGSANLERAVDWTAAEFRRDGLEHVWTEEVMVPHWVRGEASATIVSPNPSEIALLALGGSVATPEGGLRAEVLVVDSFEQLEQAGEAARGKIVLFNRVMERGFGPNGYGGVAPHRVRGAAAAAKQGAVAHLVRSLGTADFRLPHTGAMRYEEGVLQIPSAAIAAEDAALIQRFVDAGEKVEIELTMTPRTLADARSANVLAEIRGSELPEEIVVISAHLDSWDVGSGAIDDGSGCAMVLETMRLLRAHGLVPRRTIRAILFTNEENGLRGGKEYAERHAEEMPRHVAAIESDSGGATPVGFGVTGGAGAVEMLRTLARPLSVIGAHNVREGGGGADISPMKRYGVPTIGLHQQTEHYFDYHHTEADTLDKLRPEDLDRNVAAMALIAYLLADAQDALPRIEDDESQP